MAFALPEHDLSTTSLNLQAFQTHLNSSEEENRVVYIHRKNYSKQILYTSPTVRYSLNLNFIWPSKCDKLALKKVILVAKIIN